MNNPNSLLYNQGYDIPARSAGNAGGMTQQQTSQIVWQSYVGNPNTGKQVLKGWDPTNGDVVVKLGEGQYQRYSPGTTDSAIRDTMNNPNSLLYNQGYDIPARSAGNAGGMTQQQTSQIVWQSYVGNPNTGKQVLKGWDPTNGDVVVKLGEGQYQRYSQGTTDSQIRDTMNNPNSVIYNKGYPMLKSDADNGTSTTLFAGGANAGSGVQQPWLIASADGGTYPPASNVSLISTAGGASAPETDSIFGSNSLLGDLVNGTLDLGTTDLSFTSGGSVLANLANTAPGDWSAGAEMFRPGQSLPTLSLATDLTLPIATALLTNPLPTPSTAGLNIALDQPVLDFDALGITAPPLDVATASVPAIEAPALSVPALNFSNLNLNNLQFNVDDLRVPALDTAIASGLPVSAFRPGFSTAGNFALASDFKLDTGTKLAANPTLLSLNLDALPNFA
jgi:hypothetical protein